VLAIRRDRLHARRYATINTAGPYFAWAFGIEAAQLIGVGVIRGRLLLERPTDAAGQVGAGMFLFALVAEPLIGPLLGRGWRGLELFGVAPDPTAIATLGLLLLARVRHRWVLMTIPVLWCATTGLFLWAMKAPDAWIAPVAAALAAGLSIRRSRAPRRTV